MAEAQLELDVTPALAAIDEINAAFDAAAANFSDQLNSVLVDALSPQIAEIGSELDSAFAGVGDQLSGAFDNVDLSNLQVPDFATANDELAGLSENLDSVGESSGKAASAFNLQEGAATALEVATGTLEGSSGSLLRTMIPGVAIFGGITAAISGLVEKGDKAILATSRMNQVFGDAAPGIFNTKLTGLNLTLDELDKKNGTSGSSLKLLMATFGQTALGAGATKEEAANVSREMGTLANVVTALNPSLGTADQNFQLISRGLGGSTRLLQRYGITIDQAQQAQLALNIAHEHGRDKASLYDKQVAGLQLAMSALNDQAKKNGTTLEAELGTALESSTVKFRSLRQEVSATLTSIGTPIVEAGLKITEAFTPAIEGVIQLFGGIIDAVVPALAPIADAIATALQPALDAIPGIMANLTPIINAFVTAFAPLFDLLGPAVTIIIEFGTALLKVATPYIIEFFKGVGDALSVMIDYAKDAAKWLQDHLGPAFDFLKQKAKDLGINFGGDQGLAHSLGEAAVAAGGAAVGLKLMGVDFDTVATATQAAGSAVDLFASPLGMVVLAVAGLAAGAIYLYNNWKPFRDLVDEIGSYFENNFLPDLQEGYRILGDLAKVVGADLVNAWNDFADAIREIGDAIAATNSFKALEDLGNAIADLFDALGPVGQILAIAAAIGGIAAAFLAFGPALGIIGTLVLLLTQLGGIFAAIALVAAVLYDNFQPVTDLFDTFGDSVGRLVDRVGSQLAPIFDRVSKAVGNAAEQFDKLVPKIEIILGVIAQIIGVVVQVIAVALTPLINLIRNLLGPVFEFIGDVIITVMNSAADVIEGTINIIMGLLQIVVDLLTGDFSGAWEGVQQVVEGVMQVIEGIISQAFGLIEATIQLALGVIGAIFRTAWDTVVSIVETVWNMIKSLIQGGINFVIGIVTGFFDFYVGIWTAIYDAGVKIVVTLWNTVKGLFTDGVNAVKDFFRGIPGAILSFGETIFNAAKTIGGKIVDGIVAGVKAVGGFASDIGHAVLGGIATAVNSVIDLIQGGINSAIDLANEIPFVDIDHVKLPHLKFHRGGMVPGAPGQEVLAVLQAGEEVRSVRDVQSGKSGQNITIESHLTVAPPEGMTKDDAMELARLTAAENARQIEAVIGTI